MQKWKSVLSFYPLQNGLIFFRMEEFKVNKRKKSNCEETSVGPEGKLLYQKRVIPVIHQYDFIFRFQKNEKDPCRITWINFLEKSDYLGFIGPENFSNFSATQMLKQ